MPSGRFPGAAMLAVVVLFALGLLCKPMLVTLPFVLLLLDYWPLGRMGAGEGEQGEQGRAGEGEKGRRGKGSRGRRAGSRNFKFQISNLRVSASPFLLFLLFPTCFLLPAPSSLWSSRKFPLLCFRPHRVR